MSERDTHCFIVREQESCGVRRGLVGFLRRNPQTITVRIGQLHFTRPGLIIYFFPELQSDGVDLVHPELDEGIGLRVPFVF